MKKILAVMLIGGISLCVNAAPFDDFITVEVDGFTYELDNETKSQARLSMVPSQKSVVIPESIEYDGNEYEVVTTVSSFLQYGSSVLSELVLPTSLQSLGTSSFWNFSKIKNLTVPGSIKHIPDMCFCFIHDIDHFTIEDGVESIGNAALTNIYGVLHIPATVKEFGPFSVHKPTWIDYDFRNAEVISTAAFRESPLSSVHFSNGVYLGKNAFSGSEFLRAIFLPEVFTVEDGGAFGNCPALKWVIVKAMTPPECSDGSCVIASEISDDCVLYVPKGTLSAYRQSKAWTKFKKIVENDIASVDEIATEDGGLYEVWTISGVAVSSAMNREDALAGLAAGVYVVRHNGEAEKILLR